MSRLAWQVLVSAIVLGSTGRSQVTQLVTIATSGNQGNGVSFGASISGDGRYVAFWSYADDLVPDDTNGCEDVFVRDRLLGTTERVSVDSNGVQGDLGTVSPSISGDGRYVAFMSNADNLVPGDTNQTMDIFVRDRVSGTTTRASLDSNGVQGNDLSYYPSISSDGRYVVFYSYASNLVPGDTNGTWDTFVRDLRNGTTTRVSVDSNGVQGNDVSGGGSISTDGRFVTFDSRASNLVPDDLHGIPQSFLHDLVTGATRLVSVNSSGSPANNLSGDGLISADGRFVTFISLATNLGGDTSGRLKVYRHHVQSGETTLVSISTAGVPADGDSGPAVLSSDGRYVAFASFAGNLVPGDTNGCCDVFLRDCVAGITTRMSVDTGGTQGNARSGTMSDNSPSVSISLGGRYVAYGSDATNLVQGDDNSATDVFVHDHAATGFVSLCNPGADGVIACPCLNPPSGSDRGCNNSGATGGAVLSASGIGYLSIDSLAFTTSGEKPTALSIVMQGNSAISNGVVYGQGARCVGGPLIRRLFIKEAVAGSITAPDFGAGDPTVSARSAAKGDVIQPGQSRYYLVYYRDPNVLGGCPASSTFNSTQTGRIDWSL